MKLRETNSRDLSSKSQFCKRKSSNNVSQIASGGCDYCDNDDIISAISSKSSFYNICNMKR